MFISEHLISCPVLSGGLTSAYVNTTPSRQYGNTYISFEVQVDHLSRTH